MARPTSEKAGFDPIVVGAERFTEIAASMRIVQVDYEGTEMVGVEMLRENKKTLSYPIEPDEARLLARKLVEYADQIDSRSG